MTPGNAKRGEGGGRREGRREGGGGGGGLLMAPHQNQFSFVEYLCTLQSNLHGRGPPIPLAPLSIAHPPVSPPPILLRLEILEAKKCNREDVRRFFFFFFS